MRFSLPSIINAKTTNGPLKIETDKKDRNPPIKKCKPMSRTFEPNERVTDSSEFNAFELNFEIVSLYCICY